MEAVATKSPATREGKEKVNIIANLFEIRQTDLDVFRYDVKCTLRIVLGSEVKKEYDLTPSENKRIDFQKSALRVKIIERVFEENNLLPENAVYAYDGVCCIFANANLNMTQTSSAYKLVINEFPHAKSLYMRNEKDILECCVSITTCRSNLKGKDIKEEQTLKKQFLEIVTNSPYLMSTSFTLLGDAIYAQCYPPRQLRNKLGLEIRSGIVKSVRYIEGTKASPEQRNNPDSLAVPHMILDVQSKIFYIPQCLRQSVNEIIATKTRGRVINPTNFPFKTGSEEFILIDDFVRGLKFEYTGGDRPFQFRADGITDIPLKQLKTISQDKEVFVCELFTKEQLNTISLNYPAVYSDRMIKKKRVRRYYPMEFLRVLEHQHLPMSKQFCDPPTALKPEERTSILNEYMNILGMYQEKGPFHGFIEQFGVAMKIDPLKYTGIRREIPKVVYGQNQIISPHTVNANWRLDRNSFYVIPGKCDFLIFTYRCSQDIAQQASISIMDMLKKRRFEMKGFRGIAVQSLDDLEKVFATASDKMQNGEFIMIVFIDDKQKKDHDAFKLLERQYLVPTQQITTEIAKKIPGSMQTCSNVVNKLNLKCGGFNHFIVPESFCKNIWLNSGGTFVMGYDVCHPTGRLSRSEKLGDVPEQFPSVVGFSWNGGAHTEAFIGDFAFQPGFKESVDDEVLNRALKFMLKTYVEKFKLPSSVIIIRDGVSEGQYKTVVNSEYAAIRAACEEFARMINTKWEPKFSLFVVTKRHHVRFYAAGQGGLGNLLPGCVVDTAIVRKDINEFYLHSHRVIQGTGKSPSYQILVDEHNMSMDEAQSLMHALTYDHQIVESPISLPEPVYQADEWANRGTQLFKIYERMYNVSRKSDGAMDYGEMTKKLAFWNTRLSHLRINA